VKLRVGGGRIVKGTRKERGQGLVEFAIILPILLIILSGVLDLGRLWYAYVAVTDAAAEGATYAAMLPEDVSGVYQRAQEASGGLVNIDPNGVSVEYPPTVASGAPVTVTVIYTFTLATPFLHAIVPDGRLPLVARANEAILAGQLP
jgi:Flp pilus assembly protein TadG